MRILVIGDLRINFTYEYITQVLYRFSDAEVDVLNFDSSNSLSTERAKEIIKNGGTVFFQPGYDFLKKHRILWPFIRIREAYRYRIVKKYDVVHIHYIGTDSWVIPHYLKDSQRLVVSIYGSDLLKAKKKKDYIFHKLFNRANTITVATGFVETVLSNRFSQKYDNKVICARYGAIASEYVGKYIHRYSSEECRDAYKIPKDKKTILCGYNASPAQRHTEIISLLSRLPQSTKEQIYLLFHCSYGGSPDYITKISESLDKSGICGKIVVDFLQGEQLAMFRKTADIFLNLQPTDVLSASMIEELEAGAIVVKGDWLSYPDLENRKIWMYSIPKMDNLTGKIENIIQNFESVKKKTSANKGITELLSWSDSFPYWREAVFGDRIEEKEK